MRAGKTPRSLTRVEDGPRAEEFAKRTSLHCRPHYHFHSSPYSRFANAEPRQCGRRRHQAALKRPR
jgi:hypothetical protein